MAGIDPRPIRKLLTAMLGAGLALAACGGDEQTGSVPLSTSGATSTTVAPSAPPSTAAPTATAPPGTGSPVTPPTSPPEDLSGFQTEPFRREHPLSVPPVPQVTAIRSARHSGFDRVVFDLAGPLPGVVSVRYVDGVVADGSGDPVTVGGAAFLQVRFEQAQAHTDTGTPTASSRSRPGLAGISEIVLTGDFEGNVTFALGLPSRTSFRVLELAGPTRVVVDVRTP